MKKALVYFVVSLIIITVVSLFTLTGPIARFVINQTFEPQKLTLSSNTNISYDPFINELSITDFSLLHESTKELIKLDKLVLEIDLLPLFSQKLHINSFELFGLRTAVKQVLINDENSTDIKSDWLLNGWSTSNFNTETEAASEPAPESENTTSTSIDQTSKTEETLDPETNTTNDSKATTEPLFTNISIGRIQFENIDISAELPNQSHKIELSNLLLNNLLMDMSPSGMPTQIQFDLATQFHSTNNIELKPGEALDFEGGFEIQVNPSISITEQQITIQNDPSIELQFNDLKTGYEAKDINANVDSFALSIDNLKTILPIASTPQTLDPQFDEGQAESPAEQDLDVTGLLTWSLNSAVISNFANDVELINLANAAIAQANFSFSNSPSQPQPKYQFKTSKFELNELTLMKYLEDNKPTLSSLEKLIVNDIDASSEGVSVELVQIGKLNNNIIINEAKQLANLYLPAINQSEPQTSPNDSNSADIQGTEDTSSEGSGSEGSGTDDKSSDAKSTQKKGATGKNAPEQNPENHSEQTAVQPTPAAIPNFPFRLKEIVNIAPLTTNTVDMSVSPIYRSLLEVSYFSVQNIDTQKPEQASTLSINATNNKYAKIDINAQSKPFNTTPTHDIQINLNEIDMAAISPYISGALGYHINSGQMDSQVTAQVIDQKIEGNADLLLRTMDLTAISNEGEESSVSGGAISFNYALGMLKDGDGNVDLSVPFSGDLNNPSVGFSGFLSLIVKRATMSAAKDYLINTFVPYANVVNFALSASKHILKLRFNDLTYEAKQTSLNDSQKDMLSQLSEVLKKHDSVSIKLCPVASPVDLELEVNSENELTAQAINAKSITSTQVSTLLDLAQERANEVKNYLVDQGNIASKRLQFCSPTINYDINKAPKVAFDQLN